MSPPQAVAHRLPALSEHRWLRFVVFTALYFVQGIPIGLVQGAFPPWLTARGLSTGQIAHFVAITTLPWALKLVSAPFMDRLSFPAMGTRRPWVLGTQMMIVLASCGLWFFHDPGTELNWLIAACTVLNSWAAIQDVAVDGMAITVLRDDERGRANAFMIAGQVTGSGFTMWAGARLLNAHGIPAAGALVGGAVAVVGVLALLFRERPGERLLPWSAGAAHPEAPAPTRSSRALARTVLIRLVLPMSLVILLVEASYRTLEGVTGVWWPHVAIKVHDYTVEQYTTWAPNADYLAAALGLGIGVLVDRIGGRRSIALGLTANATLYASLWVFQDQLARPLFAIAMLAALTLAAQWMFISTVSMFMKLCSPRVAATQFAIYMALSNLARSGGSKIFPSLHESFGEHHMFAFMAGGYLVSLLLLAFFRLDRHQRDLARLEGTPPPPPLAP